MFREIIFYDSYTNEVSSTWWFYLLVVRLKTKGRPLIACDN